MDPERLRLTSEDRSHLVAYLDGELPEELSRALAVKLSHSPSARHEVESYQKTWELLAKLPMPKAGGEFTSSTVTLATGSATLDDRISRAAQSVFGQAGRLLVLGLTVAVMAGAGYVAARWLWPDPTDTLARDLSIAENLKGYRAVGRIEFLKELDESPEFARLAP